jgi:hypothetical protein
MPRNIVIVLIEKCLGKCSFDTPRKRWKDNIKGDLREGCEDRRWLEPAQDPNDVPWY